MKAWRLTNPHEISLEKGEEELTKKGFCKVRITLAGLSSNDFDIYRGKANIAYPVTIGRQAIGIVSEINEEETYIKKGDRVVISPFFPCGACLDCKQGNENLCKNLTCAGISHDGFLRDFIVVPIKNLYVLPERISDENAIFIPYIASAMSVIDRISCEVGEFIGVGSAGVLGNLIAQLAIYYQAIPIVLDRRKEQYLDIAKQVGVYYVFNDDENTEKKIMQVTSGKMVDSMIYIKSSSMPILDSFKFIKNCGELAISSVATADNYSVSVPVMELLRRETKIIPINQTPENF
ncbi:MAG: alcohol dehydrogenase catalytic domain-containing protein, partial [Clostridia bacterium]